DPVLDATCTDELGWWVLPESVFFFFSSRRRHTSFSRDWSSDVCSSDLLRSRLLLGLGSGGLGFGRLLGRLRLILRGGLLGRGLRSEERRGGKECRSRGWAYVAKQKFELLCRM